MSIWDNVKLPKVLYQATSQYNGNVEVWEAGTTRKLISDGTVQAISWDSPNAQKMVFGQVVEILKEHEPQLHSILILGLAGGAMPHLISKAFPGVKIVSVEIDSQMVEIAKQYFNLDDIPNHSVIVEDAFRVIVEPEEHGLNLGEFDAVVVDIYSGDKFPDLGHSGNFFASLKRLLRPGGLAVFNRIYLDAHQDDVDHFTEDLSGFFQDVDMRTIAGKTNSDNVLIFGRA
jgi:spermidine synthase